MRIHNREELSKIREMAADKVSSTKCRILICAGTGCLAGGSGEIYVNLQRIAKMLMLNLDRRSHMEVNIQLQ